ncbi:MAG: hypothetical protein NC335_00670 [Bacteroides sp.]|nr:hypothetical protein [Bacteroides sp.]
MKLKNILTSFAAAAAALAGCTAKLPVELDVIKVDRSYVPLAKVVTEGETSRIEELDNVVNMTATVDWEIDSKTIPAGLEVSPTSGTAGDYKLTFTRTEMGKDDLSAEIRIDAAGRVQFIKVFYPGDPALKPQFPAFEAGDYWIMFKHDTKWVALKGLELGFDDNSYGYIYAADANGEFPALSSTASSVYTFEACDGGFHIKTPNGGYIYQAAKYNNFYLTADASKADVWTIEQQSEETYMVNNETVSKFLQYTTGYSSAGAYAAMQDGGVLPFLVKAEDPAPEVIKLDETEFSFEKEAGEFTVTGTINADAIKVSTDASWLHYQGNDATALYFSYDYNEGGARTATVKVTANLGEYAGAAEFTVNQDGAIIDATAAEINAAEDGSTIYRLTGYITKDEGNEYGNIYVKDATGEAYCYGVLNAAGETKKWKEMGISEGDIVTVTGPKTSYNSKPQLKNVSVEEHIKVTDISLADFRNLPDDKTAWYRISGKVGKSTESGTKWDIDQYGNFALIDGDTEVYVYGVKTGWGGAKGEFGKLGIKEGDELTIVCYKTSYGGLIEADGCFYVSHNSGEGGETPEVPGDLQVKWGSLSSAYLDGVINLNGVDSSSPAGENVKFGTSKLGGSAVATIPAGTKKISFYALAWKGVSNATIELYNGTDVIKTCSLIANDGVTGTSPYTISVTESDVYFEYEFTSVLTADTEIKFSTETCAKRAIIWGVKAE